MSRDVLKMLSGVVNKEMRHKKDAEWGADPAHQMKVWASLAKN